MTSSGPDLIVTGGRVYTATAERPWAEAFAVSGGRILAVGDADDILPLAGAGTEILDVNGLLVMPGLTDVHIHLGLGGSQAAWELPILPTDEAEEIYEKVSDWAQRLGPDEWIVGGIVGSTTMDAIMTTDALARLDEASGGRPLMLRDDSMHNRWVNSRALELMGVTGDTPDPSGGTFVRDARGKLTGVLHEITSARAEAAVAASLTDPRARHRVSYKKAVEIINSYGITAVQDAATMKHGWLALSDLDAAGELSSWVVGSMPNRPFLEEGEYGEELYPSGLAARTTHVRPDFIKFVLDGVPMTRTSAMLHPYVCHQGEDPQFHGDAYWTKEELLAGIEYCYDHGFGGKLHATGDASVRMVLDAVEDVRRRRGPGPIFQIAHVEFIDDSDIPRFAELEVVPDASPYIWYPGVIQESIQNQIPAETVMSSWPTKSLLDSGALLSAGSDWPCVLPTPDPWLAIETLVTRANVDPAVPGELNPSQRLGVEEAVVAFTRNPAKAMGLAEETGTIAPGLSAEFIVLDRDIFAIDPRSIHSTRVLATYFEGVRVFEAAESSEDDVRVPSPAALAGLQKETA
ncbi:amidohydrolase [Microbacterium ulmi]|uniref:Amidohydrolase n=1 Tax=Microbacterium ulmi TaxID=179095 RepID=A0A7Y2Q1Y5_9MICO|nr:amidohydrolase [Microbacterium ulmi]NII70055.1 hypothetical protein [Microbacterium ulmi]NNH04857.1 amidohydrolase [Microbacterium ulmi]